MEGLAIVCFVPWRIKVASTCKIKLMGFLACYLMDELMFEECYIFFMFCICLKTFFFVIDLICWLNWNKHLVPTTVNGTGQFQSNSFRLIDEIEQTKLISNQV